MLCSWLDLVASDGRLAGKQGRLREQQRQAGEAHVLGLAVKPNERRGTELENRLLFTESQFHDAFLGEGFA
jgi:hypothetical protein